MSLDADLLSQARTAEARVIDAEHDAEVARAEFHRAVRRLQLAGGSLREIAQALNLSHQRVHQIVESAGGSRGWRKSRADPGERLSCSFCGKHQKQVKKLIAGPGVYICNECIDRVHKIFAATNKTARTPIATIVQVREAARTERCSFCGKRRYQAATMASTGHVQICNECVELCDEITSEELDRPGR
jgi:hypothetical protein